MQFAISYCSPSLAINALRRTYLALGVDVRDISRDTGCALDIEKGELADTRVELQEEGQRLSDTTGGTENGDFGGLMRGTVSQPSMA